MPHVSIGLPVYNGENYLREALDTLLAQTYRDFEIVICDNASDDATQSICEEYARKDSRIAYSRNDENLGAARNYNLTVERSSGALFKWAAHDDVLEDTYFERCVEVFAEKPDATAVYPRTQYTDGDGTDLRISDPDLSIDDPDPTERVRRLVDLEIGGDDVLMSIFGMFRMDALRETELIGAYPASDQVTVLELLLRGTFVEIDEPLFRRRMHPLISMAKNRTPHAQAQWFDTSHKRRVVMPMWGLWRQHIAAVKRSPLERAARTRCYYHFARRFMRMWGPLTGEVKKSVFQLAGRRR